MSDNQRAHARKAVIALDALIFDELRVTEASLLDLSEGGAFVVCDVIPKTGTQVDLVGRYRGRAFSVPSTVRWAGRSELHDRSGFGVQWEQLPLALKNVLTR